MAQRKTTKPNCRIGGPLAHCTVCPEGKKTSGKVCEKELNPGQRFQSLKTRLSHKIAYFANPVKVVCCDFWEYFDDPSYFPADARCSSGASRRVQHPPTLGFDPGRHTRADGQKNMSNEVGTGCSVCHCGDE